MHNRDLLVCLFLFGKTTTLGREDENNPRSGRRRNVPRLCRKAEIGERQWHPLRHTFCTHLAMRAAPVRTIQELAGHQDIQTTLRYMHLVKGAREDAISLLDSAGLAMRSIK